MRRWKRVLLLVLVLFVLTLASLWVWGPDLIQPVADFPQGPGGAVAYISLYRQFQPQIGRFALGEPFQVVLTEEEFSGMLRSAVLSGWRGPIPQPRIRALLRDGIIQLDMIVHLYQPQVPARLQGPVGLVLDLEPVVPSAGPVRFRIRHAAVGRIPLSASTLRLLGRLYPSAFPGFNPDEPSLSMPFDELVISSLGRAVAIQAIQIKDGRLTLTVVAAPLK